MNKKRFGKILIIVLVMVIVFLSGTYALVIWKSTQNTELTLRIGDLSGVFCTVGDEVTISNIGPVFDYLTDGEVINFSIINQTNNSSSTSASFHVTSITDNLKNASFKYAILSSSDNVNYNVINSGNFSSVTSNSDITLFSNYTVNLSSNVYFKFIIYIDGNIENPVSIQNGSLVGYLTACDIS